MSVALCIIRNFISKRAVVFEAWESPIMKN